MDELESQSVPDAATKEAGDNDANGCSAVAAATTATTMIVASSSADVTTRSVCLFCIDSALT